MEEYDENRKLEQAADVHLLHNQGNELIVLDKEKINHQYIYRFITRGIDIIGSSIGLILLSPLFLVVAFLIKKEEPQGTVFYSQERVGKNEKTFKMYKFRSMCMDADERLKDLLDKNEVEGAMFKMKDDPRITKVGKFIRRTSIDELPQFWNVFKGSMSLVGPRPPLPREVKEYTEYDRQRLYVKPGCTGLWQISGRNDVGFYDMVDLDIKYIQNQNFWNDIKILLKTVKIFLHPNGAY